MIRIIIFGASGMVGEGVLLTSLEHDAVESVLVIGRRSCGVKHLKLKEIIHTTFFDYSSIRSQLTGYDGCFFCLGVSSVGMKEPEYRRITYDLTMEAAKVLSSQNSQMTFCYVSGTGTDSTEQGRLMWARVKGKTENDLMKLPFKSVYAFRPGLMNLVQGQKNVKPLFRAAASIFPFLKLLFPGSVSTLKDVGLAMINSVLYGYPEKVLENRDIAKLAKRGSNFPSQ